VHACRFGRRGRKLLPLEARSVNTRYFVNAAGDRRAYTFKRAESRRLTLEDSARQVAEAAYCCKGPPFFPPRPVG